MPSSRTSPMTQRALAFLEDLVVRYEQREEYRLPTVAELSRMAGVSPVTMRKAVRELRDNGVLSVSQRRGISLNRGERTTQRAQPQPRPARWREVAEAIERDIVTGVLAPGSTLPTTRELTSRYGAGSHTLHEALVAVQARKWLQPHGRGYRVAALRPTSEGHVVLVCGVRREDLCAKPKLVSRLQAFERECSRRGVELVRVFDGEDVARGTGALGCVVLPEGTCGSALDGLVRPCARTGRPVAVLVEPGSGDRLAAGETTRVCLVPMGTGEDCGYHVGQYAVSAGHRSMVYLSPWGEREWSRRRLEGMRQAVEHLAVGGAVHAIMCDTSEGGDRDEAIAGRVRALCDAAMELPDATLWVPADDRVACLCAAYLAEAGTRVPDDLSIVSFGDTPDAVVHDITSYEFGERAVMHRLLDIALGDADQSATVPVEQIAGSVTQRGSSRRL